MGAFGTTKGAEIRTMQKYTAGEEVFVNYGPKSAAEYLLEHGFIPKQAKTTAVSELTFEIDPEDRFYDDKLDILEFETYDSAPMEPSQSFDVVYEPGRDGEPDPAICNSSVSSSWVARMRSSGIYIPKGSLGIHGTAGKRGQSNERSLMRLQGPVQRHWRRWMESRRHKLSSKRS